MRKNRTHTHDFVPHPRPILPGDVACKICGFRIPGASIDAARNAGAKFS